MIPILDEIEGALKARLWYLALTGALLVPDICAALGDTSGKTNENKYIRWVQENQVDDLWRHQDIVKNLYKYRNAVVHQSRLDPGHQPHVPRLMFFQPGQDPGEQQVSIHGPRFVAADGSSIGMSIDLEIFCRTMVDSARQWLGRNSHNQIVLANIQGTIRKHPGSEFPVFSGISQPFYA
ncbi:MULTISPECIES: hypothetical protein [unclassified Rathayibacter]|uniref:hypothetical protein n=1 Tax=unclassified Rathayibacter TaxID=2609250 RepID=UPI0011B08911|nr:MULTISPECIES: hypothetical protein [unclassified Rathayibacter]